MLPYELAEIPGKASAKQSVWGFKLLGNSYLHSCVFLTPQIIFCIAP